MSTMSREKYEMRNEENAEAKVGWGDERKGETWCG